MTTGNTSNGQPGAPTRTVAFDRLGCVLGTGWEISAPRLSYRGRGLIEPDQLQEDCAHRLPLPSAASCAKHACRAATSRSNSASRTIRRPVNKYAPSGPTSGSQARTNAARSLRRARLRSTADPNFRPNANATIGCGSGRGENVISTPSLRTRLPLEARSAKTARLRIRQITHSGVVGLWPAATAERRALHGWPSWPETHVCGPSYDCWAETYASRDDSPSDRRPVPIKLARMVKKGAIHPGPFPS